MTYNIDSIHNLILFCNMGNKINDTIFRIFPNVNTELRNISKLLSEVHILIIHLHVMERDYKY